MLKSFNIGNLEVANQVVVAPMAGVTDTVFRRILKKEGAGLVYTEMVSSLGLKHYSQKTNFLLSYDESEKPIVGQLFGSDPDAIVNAGIFMQERGFDVIDINMACPMPKITENGDGACLMKTPDKVYKIVKALSDAVDIPVTVKIRSGWDSQSINAVEVALAAQEGGADAVAIHGRTRAQRYTGKADWDVIADVKRALKVPLLASGDVFTSDDVVNILNHTKADAVMLGRGVLGNPWLVKKALAKLDNKPLPEEPTIKERLSTAYMHIKLMHEIKGKFAFTEGRKHLAWYINNIPDAAAMRSVVFTITDMETMYKTLNEYCLRLSEEEIEE
jgi:tRNA-dihydrouridine synthase B